MYFFTPEQIRYFLFEHKDEKYRDFSAKLLPPGEKLIGVRIPVLQKLAKEIAAGDYSSFLCPKPDEYFEETLLRGLVIGNIRTDISVIFKYISDFIPQINNWSVCDSFCASLKIAKHHKPEMWGFISTYINSDNKYAVRFAVVMMLDFYVCKEYIDRLFLMFDSINNKSYITEMAVAWAISKCYVKFHDKTIGYLNNNNLDNFTYNKVIQKIIESRYPGADEKDVLRKMKR